MAWWYAAVWVISMVVVYASMPKPQSQPPATLDEVEAPTAEEGREIGVLFGTKEIKSANVVWYGDLRVVPIRKKGGKK